MPTNHIGNTQNGNALRGLASAGHTLTGRLTHLPIYEIRYFTLANSPLSGENGNLTTIIGSIERDDTRDMENGYRQPTDHGDTLGNLPVAPGGKVVYREYFLPGNKFTWPGFVRIVADLGTKRLFITPTHYDVWLLAHHEAAHANVAHLIAPATAGAHNPFFLLSGAGAVNDVFA